jgi:hypothetical protein
MLAEGLPQSRWPQQAADVVGSEWRTALSALKHAFLVALATIIT